MLSIAEALKIVLEVTPVLDGESIGLRDLLGRTLAVDIAAPHDVPGFANSQMDGFALRAGDLAPATQETPVVLRVLGTAAAGHPFAGRVEAGTAVRIMTGAPVPEGADAVVPVERASVSQDGVALVESCPAGRFVRSAGEDLRAGEVALGRGRVLRAADLGLLASMGFERVSVHRRPRVAIVGTGEELVPVGEPLGLGQVHDSNAYALAGAVAEAGAIAEPLGVVGDDRESLKRVLGEASRCDFVLSTGGVSVGDFDYVKEVMDAIGLERHFWRVAQKPGKPLVFASGPSSLYFGLPGNPVSALVCFLLYVAPSLHKAQGHKEVHLPTIEVRVAEETRTSLDFTELVRCRLERRGDGWEARSTGSQSSGVLKSLSLADALVVSPPGCGGFQPGDVARALKLTTTGERSSTHPFA